MIDKVRSFALFWYDFVVGDDWRVAVGVVIALLATLEVSESTSTGWWIVPVVVVILLPYSLWRAIRRTPHRPRSPAGDPKG